MTSLLTASGMLRRDGGIMVSNLISDPAARVTASFTVPMEATTVP